MRRGTGLTIGVVIVVIIAAVIAIAATHKDNNKTSNSSSGASNTSQTSATRRPAVNNSIVQTKTDPALGKYLADPSGKPLYTYNADTSGTSNCTGSCLTIWPPYLATSTTTLPSGITTIKRPDTGAMQYAYNGMPLYYFTGDSSGKVTGNGVDNFAIAKPASTSAQPSSSSSGSNNSNSNSSGGYPY
jgi:predicted lipoprotein with Yx(FWY)xxD motif